MVEAEGQVEGRVADAGAFGIEEHRAVRPEQDILRADVAVDHRQASRRGAAAQRKQLRFEVRMPGGGGFEVGLQPDMLEYLGGRELRCDRFVTGRAGVDLAEPRTDVHRHFWVRAAVAQLGFPQFVFRGVEVFHRAEHRCVVVRDNPRRRARHEVVGDAVPGDLEAIALDRREPVGLDPELGQRPLDAETATVGANLPDIGRDPAGQRLELGIVDFAEQAELLQALQHRPVGRIRGWFRYGHSDLRPLGKLPSYPVIRFLCSMNYIACSQVRPVISFEAVIHGHSFATRQSIRMSGSGPAITR